jgi:hypothetical protein
LVECVGYDAFPESETLPQRLLAKRQEMGWSIKEAARSIGVDPGANGNAGRPFFTVDAESSWVGYWICPTDLSTRIKHFR